MARRIILAMAVISALLQLQSTAAENIHVVGGSVGWRIPPGGTIAYVTWASMQTFTVGDVLVFDFRTGEQDVAVVTKDSYQTCNSTNPIDIATTGPANFTLNSVGDYYFISTLELHCPLGQKLAIYVTSPAPFSSPSRKPVTYNVGGNFGWHIPPGGAIFYDSWAYDNSFVVGDTLVFNFANDTQDVALVTKEVYETCKITRTLSVWTDSPAKVTLTATGEYFFTSTYPNHCELGQKLAINVDTASSSTATPPSSISTALPPTSITSSPGPIAHGAPPLRPPSRSLASAQVVGGSYITIFCIFATVFV